MIFCWQLVAEIERLSILGNLLLSTGNIATFYVTRSNLLPATRLLATSCLVYEGLEACTRLTGEGREALQLVASVEEGKGEAVNTLDE